MNTVIRSGMSIYTPFNAFNVPIFSFKINSSSPRVNLISVIPISLSLESIQNTVSHLRHSTREFKILIKNQSIKCLLFETLKGIVCR
ncbi:hypothetical protein XNC2_0393 [Xenorhabdus nematophila AN6/1]|nr:hypothetical protein XNC2_0393 [Xenorhabdus nematophila AN6/1]